MKLIPSVKTLLQYIVSITLLTIVFVHLDVPTLIGKVKELDIRLLAASLCMIIAQIIFLSLRWHYFMRTGNNEISYKASNLINIAGYIANILFITSVGGIVTKSGLAVRHGLSLIHAISITFMDRFMTLFALILLSAIGLPFLYNTIDSALVSTLALSILGIVMTFGFLISALKFGWFRSFILSKPSLTHIESLLRQYRKDYKFLLSIGGLSLGGQIMFILSVYVLSLGLSNAQNVHFVEFISLVPIIALIASLPISFGGWGIREGAFVYGLSLIGFSMEEAFILSVQVGLVTLCAPMIMCIPYLIQPNFVGFLLGNHYKKSA